MADDKVYSLVQYLQIVKNGLTSRPLYGARCGLLLRHYFTTIGTRPSLVCIFAELAKPNVCTTYVYVGTHIRIGVVWFGRIERRSSWTEACGSHLAYYTPLEEEPFTPGGPCS